jgi:hypothetical protein
MGEPSLLQPVIDSRFPDDCLTTPLSPPPEELELYNEDSAMIDDDESVIANPPSFETLLSGLSKAPYSRVSFMSYLKTIHCSENLEFLIDSNQYVLTTKKYQSTLNQETDARFYEFIQNERNQLWTYIFKQFISHDSPKEVNIQSDLKDQLTFHFHSNSLPPVALIETTMISIKDLLRDSYFQFISHVKRSNPQLHLHFSYQTQNSRKPSFINDRVDQNYSLLPPSTEDLLPHGIRRFSEHCSPLESTAIMDYDEGNRAQSPLSTVINTESSASSNNSEFPSTGHPTIEISGHSYDNSSTEDLSKKNKNSFSEASTNLKKFAGKLRWRRMSSNSSTSSS